jgi:hypothetical protein
VSQGSPLSLRRSEADKIDSGVAMIVPDRESSRPKTQTHATGSSVLQIKGAIWGFDGLGRASSRSGGPESSRGYNASYESPDVRLPTDPGHGGHHAKYEATPHQRHDCAENDAPEAARVPAGEHQKSEIPEDHAAGADVYGARGTEQPRHEAGPEHSGQCDRNEMSLIPEHHHPAKRYEGDTVCDKVIEAAVQERREQNSTQASRRAWDDTEPEERAAQERVHDEDHPEHGERAAQNQRVGFEGASYTGNAIARW